MGVDFRVADDAAAWDEFAAGLELRLDEDDALRGDGEEYLDGGEHEAQRDKGAIGGEEGRAIRDLCWVEMADVGAF